MERRDAGLFQHDATTSEGWNIVELESHRQFRQTVNELIQRTTTTGVTTRELQEQLQQCSSVYGTRFTTQLVRALTSRECTRASVCCVPFDPTQ